MGTRPRPRINYEEEEEEEEGEEEEEEEEEEGEEEEEEGAIELARASADVLLCRKGCGRRFVYAKSLKTHETRCGGRPGAAQRIRSAVAFTAKASFVSRDAAGTSDRDVPVSHAAHAAANDAFTRAVFARLAGAGETERRFKWLDAAGELGNVGTSSGTAGGPPASAEDEEEERRRVEEE